MTTFSAVVCTKGRPDVLVGALEAIRACDPAPAEILVVDGDEAQSARTPATLAGARYVTNAPGLTRQRNRAIDEAIGDVIAFFDDDARPAPDVFGHLARAYADAGVVGATGPIDEPGDHARGGRGSGVRRLLTGRGAPGTFTRGGYPRRFAILGDDADVELMQGAFLTVRRAIAAEVRFDEALPGYGLAEDEDFSCRLSRHGRIRYLARAVVRHENLGFGTRDLRAFNHQVVVNRWYLYRKNFRTTPASLASFTWTMLLLSGHRALSREWAGLAGLASGIAAVARGRGVTPSAPTGAVRVLFVSSHARDGGSERYLERFLAHLDERWVASVVTLQSGPLTERLAGSGLEPVVIETGSSAVALVRSARRIRAHARASGCRVVHANGVKAAIVAVLAGLPTVWVKHDASLDGAPGRLLARRCRAVVGVSDAVLAGIGHPRRGRVVMPGIDVADPDREAARAVVDHLAGGRPVVVLVGRFDPVKGHLDLLDAAPAAATLLFVGADDPSMPEHAARVRAAAAGRAVLVGHRDDVATILAGSDVVAVPSATEGFGLVAAEAMAVGTPVVAYAAGAIPEVVGDCAVLVPPGDRTALRVALERVLADGELRGSLAARGRARVDAELGIERWVDAMCAVYARTAVGVLNR